MSFYAGLQATADKLLRTFGQPMTLTRRTPGAYNPATGTATVTETDFPGVGAIFDIAGQEFGEAMVQQGDRKALLSAKGLGAVPAVGMHLTQNGVEWSVVNMKAIDPAALAVVYELQVRK